MDEDIKAIVESAKTKLKEGMDGGPFGENVVLTPEEATVIYRVLFTK